MLRPMLSISATLGPGTWLPVGATLLLSCSLVLIATGISSGVRATVLVLVYLVAGWLAWAIRWRHQEDVQLIVAGLEAIAQGRLDALPAPSSRGDLVAIGSRLEVTRDVLDTQQEQLRLAYTERERQLQDSHERQRASEGRVRHRAQTIIDETATAVVMELQGLIMQVDSVRRGAALIEERVEVSDDVRQGVVDQAEAADAGAANLSRSLRSVAEMAHLIRGVADQTKLLALNATIEAARAGSAGLGFSVVAEEVKTLAVATAMSTQQITATIAALERDAEDVVAAITSVGGGITSLDEAGSVLRAVAKDQFNVVAQLDSALAATVERVETMATLNERLERRHAERYPLRARSK